MRAHLLTFVALLGAACSTLPMTPRGGDNEAERETEETPATSSPPSSVRPEEEDVGATGGDPPEERCVVFCHGVEVSKAKTTVDDAESYTVAQTENADAVLAGLNDELVRCYRSRVRVAPRAAGEVTFEIVIGDGGRVRSVTARGGEDLGSATPCMVEVLRGAQFAAPHGGGTATIKAPFKLGLRGDDGV